MRTVPPWFGGGGEQILDSTAIADRGSAGQRDVFLRARIGKGKIDAGVTRDLFVLMTPRVGQKIYLVLARPDIGAHWMSPEFIAVERHQHGEANFLHQVLNTFCDSAAITSLPPGM